jgi:hypothetical protein
LPTRNVTDSGSQFAAIDGDDLRHIRNGVLPQAGQFGAQQDVSWHLRESHVARQRDAHDCPYPALVKCISLDNEDGPAKAGSGS